MTIKEGTKRNRCRLRDNPEHRSNCLKSLRGQDVPVSRGFVNKKHRFNAKRGTNVDMRALYRRCMLSRHRSRCTPGEGHRSIATHEASLGELAGSGGCQKLL
jgi:hypothetical protein